MSKTLTVNLEVELSNKIMYELEKLSNHDISKQESHKNIMEHVEKIFLKMNVKLKTDSKNSDEYTPYTSEGSFDSDFEPRKKFKDF